MTVEEFCGAQNEIIKIQADIIDDLFLQILQYASVEEEEAQLRKMEKAAQLRKRTDG